MRLLALVTLLGCAMGHVAPTNGTPVPATAASSCGENVRCRADSLLALDPAAEAARAIARRDYRFIAVLGYDIDIPGVDDPRDPLYRWAHDSIHVIEGTSDRVTPEVARLNDVAHWYGDRYNAALLAHLRSRFGYRAVPPE